MSRTVRPTPPAPLRLSRHEPSLRADHTAARHAAAAEMRSAAALPEADARAIFAQGVERNLEGGRAAILRPENRRRLLTHAAELGLRTFDASLIIAIAQDAARRSRAPRSDPRLRLVHPPERAPSSRGPWVAMIAALTLGGAILAALIAVVR